MNPRNSDSNENFRSSSQEERDWDQYKLLVLDQLKQLKNELTRATEDIALLRSQDLAAVRIELAILKLKNTLWSALVGSIASALVTLVTILIHGSFH